MRLNAYQLAEKIGIPVMTLYRKRLDGVLGIPSFRIDNRIYFEFDPDDWIRRNLKGSKRRKKLLENFKKVRELEFFLKEEIRKDRELERMAVLPKSK